MKRCLITRDRHVDTSPTDPAELVELGPRELGKPADRASVTATSVIMAPLATAVVKDLAAQLDGLRRTRTGAWVVHGRRYRTKALAMASWKARRPRSIRRCSGLPHASLRSSFLLLLASQFLSGRTAILATASWLVGRLFPTDTPLVEAVCLAAGLAATVAPFAWGMLQAGVMRIGSAAQKEDA